MAIFNSAVLTKKGNELLIDAAAGNKITFTRMIVGCGEYTDVERERNFLEKMENLKDVKQEFTFSACRKVSERCLMLTAIISNKNLTNGYKITEIGVCGKISDDEEDFLCSIAVTNSMEESDTFPPYNGLQECQIVQDYYITISPDAEVTVITKGASVLIEDFLAAIEDIKKEFQEKIEALKKSFQDGVDKIYNKLKGLGFTPTDKSPDAICVAIQNMYDRRYSQGYNDGRTQGHADVIANPEAFGISLAPKYIETYESNNVDGTVNVYNCPADGTYTISVLLHIQNSRNHKAGSNHAYLNIGGENVDIYRQWYDYDDNTWKVTGTTRYSVSKTLKAGTAIDISLSGSYVSAEYYGESELVRIETIATVIIS